MSVLRVAPMERVEEALLAAIEEALRHCFGIDVQRHSALGAPEFAWDGARRQFSAPLILRRLLVELDGAGGSDGSRRLLAVTGRDLYIPMLSFVYGQAQLGGRAGVVSMARLRSEFYALAPDEELLRVRACKEALHEAGHLFGLVHCSDASCVMALSTGVGQIDMKQPLLCAGCAALAAEGRGEVRERR
jgi:archaemetzincin